MHLSAYRLLWALLTRPMKHPTVSGDAFCTSKEGRRHTMYAYHIRSVRQLISRFLLVRPRPPARGQDRGASRI
jgi:hypothetical protein